LVGMAEPATRAKWRALRSARSSTLKKCLTGIHIVRDAMFRQRCSWSSLWPFCNDPRQLREELNRQNALPKVGRRSWQPFGTCNPILKTGISIRQAFTRCGEFASKLEPSAISSQLAVEKSALINLPLFREVDAELIEKLAECLRVNGFPLCCEVQAIGASAPFRITPLHRGVGCFGPFPVVADCLVT